VATTKSPDPVTQAAAYQQQLLSLLGEDDPAQVQAGTAAKVRAVLHDVGVDLRRRPAAEEWSVLELLGHLTDAEIVMAGRYRWVLSDEQPELPGYDQDGWVRGLRHNDDDPEALLGLFSALRSANLQLWKGRSSLERERIGMHRERGPESYGLMFRMIAGHDRFHLNQMRKTLAQLRASR
jgi:hypothetical protein